MQKVTAKTLSGKAASLLNAGEVKYVLGWKKGEFDYDITPALFESAEELEKDFVWNDFSCANLSKYLIKYTRSLSGKILVFLKPCDTFSFNQLLTEHRIDRQKVYAVGVPCSGMADEKKIRENADGITAISETEEGYLVHTLYSDAPAFISKEEALLEKCLSCKGWAHIALDEQIEGEVFAPSADRFDQVKALENMTPDERYHFWQNELSRCIRCNACRDVCPACTCEKCVFDNPNSGVENKAAANSFEEKMFHIIRAFHVAGRCTDCGECSRVCPQKIPLHLLNRKFINDIDSFYGEYQAGLDEGSRAPLVDYDTGDLEPSQVFDWRDGQNA
ncbi:MAG: 4Fe-4S dicluster domain-containing protein [Clostridia bacterium]|nr:4Fe-4S dicluster domain-containing protein [Clostridia bacterium]